MMLQRPGGPIGLGRCILPGHQQSAARQLLGPIAQLHRRSVQTPRAELTADSAMVEELGAATSAADFGSSQVASKFVGQQEPSEDASSSGHEAEPIADPPTGRRPAKQPGVLKRSKGRVAGHLHPNRATVFICQDYLMRFWQAYSRALDTHPIQVKSATSFVGFLLGDAVAQAITGARTGMSYDAFRTLRLVIFGMLMDGPVGHLWYTFLDSKVMPDNPKSNKAVVLKMMADQFLWAPFFSCIFFGVINLLQGAPQNIIPDIQQKLIPVLLANYALWPVAHLINFKLIPSKQRILYINAVQIGWSAYLSNVSSRRAIA